MTAMHFEMITFFLLTMYVLVSLLFGELFDD